MRIEKLLISTVLFIVSSVANAATVYSIGTEYLTDLEAETAYLTDLKAIPGTTVIEEGFEDNTVWVASRDPADTPQVNSKGILWTSNFATNNITTGGLGGDTHEGDWGFYSDPHGDPGVQIDNCDVPDPIPDECFLHDGFVGTSSGAGKLNGVGGWIIDGSTAGADITVFLDGLAGTEVDFGAASTISGWTFFGVIDAAGFDTFEFREMGGKGEQGALIFGDDFNIGVSAVPVPAAVWLFGSGLLGLVGMARRNKA
jgi:hypothetical protein